MCKKAIWKLENFYYYLEIIIPNIYDNSLRSAEIIWNYSQGFFY